MKKSFLLLSLLLSLELPSLFSQCSGPTPSQFCGGDDPLCSIAELDGINCQTPPVDNPTGPTPLCNGTGTPQNTIWYSFWGDGNPMGIQITVDPASCMGTTIGCIGIQAGIIQDCLNGGSVACIADCGVSTNILQLQFQSMPCQKYYLWIDGCCGDVCNFIIEAPPLPPPKIGRPKPEPALVGTMCPCGIARVCVPPSDMDFCISHRRWTVNGIDQPNWDDMDCVEFDVPEEGGQQEVCIRYIMGNLASPCDELTVCRRFLPLPIPMVNEGEIFKCYEDHMGNGIVWHDTLITSDCINPPCSTRAQSPPNNCCVDYEAQITLLPERQIGEKYVFFCDKMDLPYRTEDGKVWATEACQEKITWPDIDYYNCDTSYYLYLSYFDPEVTLTKECAACDGEVTLRAVVRNKAKCPFGDISWEGYWLNNVLDTLAIGTEVQVTGNGRYQFVLKVHFESDKIKDPQDCVLEGLPPWGIVVVDGDIDTPHLSGATPLCATNLAMYEVLNDSVYLDFCEYRWEIQSGGGVIVTPSYTDSARILVDWSSGTLDSGIVCVTAVTHCSVSKDTCFKTIFLKTPAPDAGVDTVICGRMYTMQGKEDISGGHWEIITSPGNVTMDLKDIHSDVAVNQDGKYTFVWVEDIQGCMGHDSVTIVFNSPPFIAAADTICQGDASRYIIVLELAGGTGPYQILSGGGKIENDIIYTSDTLNNNQTYTIILEDAYGCQIQYTINYECTCLNRIGVVSSDTIKSCGVTTVAIDYNPGGMILTNTDTFHFILYSNPSDPIGSSLRRNHSGTFAFDPLTMNWGQVYYLGVTVGKTDQDGYVNPKDGCVKYSTGQPVIWYEMPSPNAGMDQSICDLSSRLNGARSLLNSNIRWLNTPNAIIGNANQLTTPVTVTQSGTYTFVIEETNAMCTNYDTVVLQFNTSPEISGLDKECVDLGNSTKWKYTVRFSSGVPPYTIVQGAGSFDANTGLYQSLELESLERDTLIIEDQNGCRDTLSVIHNCVCGDTKAGTMNTSFVEICQDSCLTILTDNNHGLEPDDCVFMILNKDSATFNASTIIEIQTFNASGNTFCFDSAKGMQLNQRYYVSYIVGECSGGQLNTEDACLKFISRPIRFLPYPTPDAGNDKTICGLMSGLEARSSIGTGHWELTNRPTNANAIFMNTMSTTPLTVDTYGKYTFKWIEDNGGCIRSDEVSFLFVDAPKIADLQYVCDSVGEKYKVLFEITGGDQMSISIKSNNGWTATPIVLGKYESPWIPSGKNTDVTIDDQYGCNPITIDVTHECMCITEAGTLSLNPDHFCYEGTAHVNYTGGRKDPNDIIVYYLHDGNANNIGTNIITTNTTGDFSFDPTRMQRNKKYYITARIGNSDGSGGVILTDRCLQQTIGVSVIWYELPEAQIKSDEQVITCEIPSILLHGEGSSIHADTGMLTYAWNTSDGSFDTGQNLNTPQVGVIGKGTYTLTVTNTITGCTDTAQITIGEDRPHLAVDAGPDGTLSCKTSSIQLDGSKSAQGANIVYQWIGPGITMNNRNDIRPIVTEPGTYRLIVLDTLTGCKDFAEVLIKTNYDKPKGQIQATGALTCIDGEILLDGTGSTSNNGIQSYTWETSTGNIIGDTHGKTIKIDKGGKYLLIIEDALSGCKDTSIYQAVEFGNTLSNITLDVQGLKCFGDRDGIIEIIGVTGGTGTLSYSINQSPFGPKKRFDQLGPGRYEVTIKDEKGCERDTVILLDEPADLSIEAKEDQYIAYGSDLDLDTLWTNLRGAKPNDPNIEILWLDESGNPVNPLQVGLTQSHYRFTVVVKDKNGCEARDFLDVYIEVNRNVFIPNVFTPQKGTNKRFYIYTHPGSALKVTYMRVYDRWGELMYDNRDIPFDSNGASVEGWDGTYRGSELDPAVFIYIIEVEFKDTGDGGSLQTFTGDITLLR